MTLDRSIRLETSVRDLGARAGEGFVPDKGRQGEPDAQARDQFQQALEARSPAAHEPSPQPSSPLAAPFGLLADVAVRQPPDEADPGLAWRRQLTETVARLYVGEGRAGGKQVRMDLDEDVLPGVSVAIEQVEGRLQVDFICRVEASRLKLVGAAPRQAPELAQRLDRPVLLRIQTDDEEDPCLLEVAAAP